MGFWLHILRFSPMLSTGNPKLGVYLPIFDGVVTLADDEVPVIVGLADDTLRLSSNGELIGEWGSGEFAIDALEGGTFAIKAESETLFFVPLEPERFAASLGEDPGTSPAPTSASPGRHETRIATADRVDTARYRAVEPNVDATQSDAAAPKAITMVAFYALAALTAALGLWALINMLL